MRFIPLLFWVCMPYGICSVPYLVQCNSRLLHMVPMMFYLLDYFGLLLFSMVGISVCSCSQILQIYACTMVGGDELFISGVDVY